MGARGATTMRWGPGSMSDLMREAHDGAMGHRLERSDLLEALQRKTARRRPQSAGPPKPTAIARPRAARGDARPADSGDGVRARPESAKQDLRQLLGQT
eukprot:1598718-Prymnesium_polylepis.1